MRGVDGYVLDLWVTWAASDVEAVVDVLLSSFFGGVACVQSTLSCVVWYGLLVVWLLLLPLSRCVGDLVLTEWLPP